MGSEMRAETVFPAVRVEAEGAVPVPAKRPKVPGSGRRKGSRNRSRTLTAEMIARKGDPIGFLCRVVQGEPISVAPEPGAREPVLAWPTMADRITAAVALGRKVTPDLKAMDIQRDGSAVSIIMNLAPSRAEPKTIEGAGT